MEDDHRQRYRAPDASPTASRPPAWSSARPERPPAPTPASSSARPRSTRWWSACSPRLARRPTTQNLSELGGGGFGGFWPAKIWNTFAQAEFSPTPQLFPTSPDFTGQQAWNLLGTVPKARRSHAAPRRSTARRSRSSARAARRRRRRTARSTTNGQLRLRQRARQRQPNGNGNANGNGNGERQRPDADADLHQRLQRERPTCSWRRRTPTPHAPPATFHGDPTCSNGGTAVAATATARYPDGEHHPGRPRRRRRADGAAGLAAVDDDVPAAAAQAARGQGRIGQEARHQERGRGSAVPVSGVRRRGHCRVRAGGAARLRGEAAVQLRWRVEQLHRPVPRRLLHRHLPALLHRAAVGGQGALLRAPGRVPGPDGLDDAGRGVGGALGRRRLRPRQGLLRRDGPDAGGLPASSGCSRPRPRPTGKATARAGRRP